jgi:hypothetical protein
VKPAALLFACLAPVCFAQVVITPGANTVQIDINGKPFTEFVLSGGGTMKPYLHPLRAATGTYVTRMWPMVADIAGEPHDHQHQRGQFIGHADVNKIDFWGNEESYSTPNRGREVPVGSVVIKGASLTARFNWTDPKDAVLLEETRTITFYPHPTLRILDFDIALTAKQKVVFGDEKDGFFAVRLRPELQEEKGAGHIVNAEGLATEKNVWGKPSNWVDYYGNVGVERVGVAIFDHPYNPRHPTRWHVRGYGLFSANPFGLAMFTGDKSQDGALTLETGQSLRFRYRVVIHAGNAQSAGIAQLYDSYVEERIN